MIASTKEALKKLSYVQKLYQKTIRKIDKYGYYIFRFSKKKWLSYNIDIDNISKVVDKLIDHEKWRGGWDHIKEKMKSGIHPEPGLKLNNLLSKDDCFENIHNTVLAAIIMLKMNKFIFSFLGPQAYTGHKNFI